MTMEKRLFIAIPLPGDFAAVLSRWQSQHRGHWPARWTSKENLHITAAFLGAVEEQKIAALIQALKTALNDFKQFNLEFKRLTPAPSRGPARMIWADFYSCQKFNGLVNKIWPAAKGYVEPEIYDNIKNPVAHVTMARLREAIYLSGLKQPDLKEKSFEVSSINLMESELTPEGPRYQVLEEIKLAAKDNICN